MIFKRLHISGALLAFCLLLAVPAHAGVDLIADGPDEAIDVGNVAVFVTAGGDLAVTLTTAGEWYLTKVQIDFFFDCTNFSDAAQKNGNAIPGQFDLKFGGFAPSQSISSSTSLSGLGLEPGETVCIAAHADVVQIVDGEIIREEGAWAADISGDTTCGEFPGKNWATYFEYTVVPPADVTAPGDVVQGVPNDGPYNDNGLYDNGWPVNWPFAGNYETPVLAIDNAVTKKFLHFKGDTEPTGIRVIPSMGATIVTGITLTTANDVARRDPTSFELYGSNEGIDGPYTLIASGPIVDFAGTTPWPRLTKNATPITFDHHVAYTSYQLLFPTIRFPATAKGMQIAEIELIGVVAP